MPWQAPVGALQCSRLGALPLLFPSLSCVSSWSPRFALSCSVGFSVPIASVFIFFDLIEASTYGNAFLRPNTKLCV